MCQADALVDAVRQAQVSGSLQMLTHLTKSFVPHEVRALSYGCHLALTPAFQAYHALFDVSPYSLVASAALQEWYLGKGKELFDAGTPADIAGRLIIQDCKPLSCLPGLLWLYPSVSMLRISNTSIDSVDWKSIPASVARLELVAPCAVPLQTLQSNVNLSSLTLDGVPITADQMPPNTRRLHVLNFDAQCSQVLLQGMTAGSKRQRMLSNLQCLDIQHCPVDPLLLRSVLLHTQALTTLALTGMLHHAHCIRLISLLAQTAASATRHSSTPLFLA